LGFSNSWRDGVGVRVGSSLVGGVGDGASLGEARIPQGLPARLGGGQGGLRALRDYRALFLGQRGV